MRLERARQAGERTAGGFAARSGIDHAVSVPFLLATVRLQQGHPALLETDPVAALRLSPSTRMLASAAAARGRRPAPGPTARQSDDEADSLERMDTVLAAERLGKQVSSPEGTLTILADVTLDVRRGESVAIVGASGAGQIHAARAARRARRADHRARLARRPRAHRARRGRPRGASRARHVGFVFQSFHLVPSLTALENVMLPLELAGRADARRTAREVLDAGRPRRNALGHYPRQLSGGEQQRVAIARAFVDAARRAVRGRADRQPRLGAPASGSSICCSTSTRRAARRWSLVTHDRSIAARCGRLIRLDAGRMVEGQA